MQDQVEKAPDLVTSFPSHDGNQELLAQIFALFPYPIQIFSADGTARLINQATLEMIGIRSRESHVGIYNVFEDPIVLELGVMDQVKQVLSGKTVFITDFNASYKNMMRHFDVEDRDIQTISADITCFPLANTEGVIDHFAAVFLFKKIYRRKEEVERGRQYIEAHWQDRFDANATAEAACLSKTHFTKLFKKHTGITPYEYHINYRIGKLKEKLLDTSLSVAQAFAACNMDYNGHSARLFRKKVGINPSEYRNKTE